MNYEAKTIPAAVTAADRTTPPDAAVSSRDSCGRQAQPPFSPSVSIVIPVYNGADYLADAIDSALAQTYDNVEVIVVNDGSSDEGASKAVALTYGERVRYVEKPNGGVATALNRGVTEMNGDYFSWLSHDDLYLPNKIESQINALAQMPDPARCVVYGDCAVFSGDPGTAKPLPLPSAPPGDFRRFITMSNELHGCTLLVPRLAFAEHGGFNSALRTTQDYDLWFRMAAGFTFVHLPGVVVLARNHPGQGSHRSDLVLQECNRLLGNFVGQLSAAQVRQGMDQSLAEGYFRLADNLKSRGFSEAGARAINLCRQHAAAISPDDFLRILSQQAQTTRDLAATTQTTARLPAEIDHLTAAIRDICQQRDAIQVALELELQAEQARSRQLGETLAGLYASHSWRMTAPLRRVAEYFHLTVR